MNKRDLSGKSQRNTGICILLAALFLAGIACAGLGKDYFTESLLMLSVVFLGVFFAAFSVNAFAIMIESAATVIYIASKFYMKLAEGSSIEPLCILWILIPAASVTGMILFMKGVARLRLDNEVLSKQVDDLVMIDRLTGLYNLRSMYMDIQTQISYSERNHIPITLMIIRLRYLKEMKALLKKEEFEELVVRLSKYVFDIVRLEDRVYSLDEDGTFGVILTCDKEGTGLVEKRLRDKLSDPASFANITDKAIRMDVKIGYLEYKKEEFNRDARLFKESVEEEVAYDI